MRASSPSRCPFLASAPSLPKMFPNSRRLVVIVAVAVVSIVRYDDDGVHAPPGLRRGGRRIRNAATGGAGSTTRVFAIVMHSNTVACDGDDAKIMTFYRMHSAISLYLCQEYTNATCKK